MQRKPDDRQALTLASDWGIMGAVGSEAGDPQMAAATLLEGMKIATAWLLSLVLPAGPPLGLRAEDAEVWSNLLDRL